MKTTSISEQLKQETLQAHQQLEKAIVSKIKAIRTRADYGSLLNLFYTYFGGLEAIIAPHLTETHLPDIAVRRKAELIKHDLLTTGNALPPKATVADLPAVNNHLQAFGALYVMEGSTLGGQIISQLIAKQLGRDSVNCLTFFSGYGADTMPMWGKFKASLEQVVHSQHDADVIINTANETFIKFKRWIDVNEREEGL